MAEIIPLHFDSDPEIEQIMKEIEETVRKREEQIEDLEKQADSGNIFAKRALENLVEELWRRGIESSRYIEEMCGKEKAKEKSRWQK